MTALNDPYDKNKGYLTIDLAPLNVPTIYEGHYLDVLQHCGDGDLSLEA